ncbi:unnamed protein product [Auanema sp. JU1783]|nr:unnamed protein product [Auanema sp. JU1783]
MINLSSTLDILETSTNSALISALNTPERLTENLCDKDDELAKISCLSASDNEELWDGFLRYRLASAFNDVLFTKTLFLIGSEELRKTVPQPIIYSLDSYYYYEHNFLKAIASLDKHAPVIRAVFRCKFEMIRSLDEEGLTERQRIDRMIAEQSTIEDKLRPAIRRMFSIFCLYKNESQT